MKLTGFLKLAIELGCSGDVLGKTFPAKINGIDAVIAFPQFKPKNEINNPSQDILIAPIGAEEWHYTDGKPLFWGHASDSDHSAALVEQIVIYIECSDDDQEAVAKNIYEHIHPWEESFLNYCRLSSAQFHRWFIKEENEFSDFTLYSHDIIDPHKIHEATVIMGTDADNLSGNQIQKALDFASSGKELLFEYQMLLSAYTAFIDFQYRQAIVDASSALEICLDKQIEAFCRSKNINPMVLTDAYWSLKGKAGLIPKIIPSFQINNITEKVIKLRNEVAHSSRHVFSTEETRGLIKKVEECLAFFYNDYF